MAAIIGGLYAIFKGRYKKLIKLGEEKQIVTITGINGMGQQFVSKGILMAEKGKNGKNYYISEKAIGLWMGQYIRDNTKAFCAFYPDYDEYHDKMYIKEIQDENGNMVYSNKEYEQIEGLIIKKLEHNGLLGHAYSKKGKNCKKLIGKPVIIKSELLNEERYMIKTVYYYKTKYGRNESLECTNGISNHGFPIDDKYDGYTICLDVEALQRLGINYDNEEINTIS